MTRMYGWEILEVENGRDVIKEEVLVSKAYHTSARHFNLQINDTITLEAREGMFGNGVYFSSRLEPIYGNVILVVENMLMNKVCQEETYEWYTIPTTTFKVISIDSNIIYLKQI